MTPVQAAIQRGDAVPRAVYETLRRQAADNDAYWRSSYWTACRLACYLLCVVCQSEDADAVLDRAAETMGWGQ